MNNQVKYKVLIHSDLDTFEQMVNYHLNQGYELHGHTTTTSHASYYWYSSSNKT